jgi:hypothetical protein
MLDWQKVRRAAAKVARDNGIIRDPVWDKSLRIALRQQNEHRNARGRHRQKPLPDPRNQMDGIHVSTPLTELSNS